MNGDDRPDARAAGEMPAEVPRCGVLTQGGRRALELVARRVALTDVLNLLARLIEQQSSGTVCSILLADPTGQRLRLGAAPRCPARLKSALESAPIDLSGCPSSAALHRREPVIVEDIASSPRCSRIREAALSCGLRACWSAPFLSSDGRGIGTVTLFHRTPRTPSPYDLQLLERAANVIGMVVEREEIERERARLAEEAAAKHATLSAVLESMSDGLVTLDPTYQIRYCNERAARFLGVAPARLIGSKIEALITAMEHALARPADLGPAVQRALERLDERPSLEVMLARPHPCTVAVQFFPVTADDRRLLRIGVLLRDVAEAKRLALLQDRERIAMDLHDGIVQSLYGLALSFGARKRSIPSHWTETRGLLQHGIDQINMIIRDIRQYIRTLQPERVTERDIRTGLAALLEELRVNGLLCPQVELDPEAEELLDTEAAGHLLYIAHEATSNIIRHARASAATIRLVRLDGYAALTVSDDGRGFVPHRTGRRTGDGLRNMAERAAMIGGRLIVHSAPGRGTEVRVEIPLPVRRSEP